MSCKSDRWSGIRTGRVLLGGRAQQVRAGENGETLLMSGGAVNGTGFLPPCEPLNVWCVGKNYADHAKECDSEVPPEPCIFLKSTSCICGHDSTVVMPSWAGRVDYEGELAVVIAEDCKNVPEAEALDVVEGYTCFNDVTARDVQWKDGQWTRGKNFDNAAPIGPWLLHVREMPQTAVIRTLLNGKVVQESTFGNMMYSVARIISHISAFATLHAGDVIATGTPAGIGGVKNGDVTEIVIDGIGTLRTHYVIA